MKTALLLSCILLQLLATGQNKSFEGVLTYRTSVTSKVDGISNKAYQSLLFAGDSIKIFMKEGNVKTITPYLETYTIGKDQKVYNRFKGIDTLFVIGFDDNADELLKAGRSREQQTIAGYNCKSFSTVLKGKSIQYFYAPDLYQSPEYFHNMKTDRYDVFINDAKAVYLALIQEYSAFQYTQHCTRVQQQPINDSIFALPALPVRQMRAESVVTPAEYAGPGTWNNFLARNINADIGARHVKIKKGEIQGSEVVMVGFVVNERGRVLNPVVTNRKEVHPKLAEEALRVVGMSPLWKPASAIGNKVPYWINQPITFSVFKE